MQSFSFEVFSIHLIILIRFGNDSWSETSLLQPISTGLFLIVEVHFLRPVASPSVHDQS